jgi:hypothetical protein
MANALTNRQMAKIFTKQALLQSKLSVKLMKDANDVYAALPADKDVTAQQLRDSGMWYDLCVRAAYTADGFTNSAQAANEAADLAGEPA